MAFKMATGSGKTVVMAMLIAWHTLNKLANPQDARSPIHFSSSPPASPSVTGCACCCPTTRRTITANVTSSRPQCEQLGKAKMVITNFHAFKLRETIAAGKLTKTILKDQTEPIYRNTRPDGAPRLP